MPLFLQGAPQRSQDPRIQLRAGMYEPPLRQRVHTPMTFARCGRASGWPPLRVSRLSSTEVGW